MSANVRPDLAPGVALVANDTLWMELRPSSALFDGTLRHQGLEHGRFMTLTRCERQGHQMAVCVDAHMHFGAETALTAT